MLRNGADDYIDKPFSVEELFARVRNFIGRKRAEDRSDRLRHQIEEVSQASKSVSEAIAGLPESSVLAVLQTIAMKALSLTSAEFSAVGIGSDPNRPFESWGFAGLDHEQAARIGRYPRPVGLLGLVGKDNRGIRLRDLRNHPEHRGFPPGHPAMTSFLGVPIQYRSRAVGNMYLTNKQGADEFTPEDQDLLEMLADDVGVAIELARLYSAEGKERAWLQAVVDQMPEGIVLMDAEGHVTLENRFMRALAEGGIGTLDLRKPSGELVSPDDLPIARALSNQETTQGYEAVARRADGRLVALLVGAAPIKTRNGELVGATMILQDVSPLKELEQLREEWASIIAHDLQQPIHAILLRADLLLRGELRDEQKHNVRQIRETVVRVGRMVSDLLDASLVDANRLRIKLDRLDFGELLRAIIERVPGAWPRTTMRMPAESPLFVRGDAHRLEQVVTNLLSNAVKYGAADTGIQIDVAPCNEFAEVSVTNYGEGIPADELPLIFERYARSRTARMSGTKGLGLGLYIAKGLVEAHGGRIWAESVPGESTVFRFTVPLDRPTTATQTPLLAAGAHQELKEILP
jgi:PAS domain S-box-containing protein